MSSERLRVAVVGGGVCGLTCAITLLQQGADVHVYEAAAKFGEIGAGIGVGQNAARILKAIGVYDDIKTLTKKFEHAGGQDAQLKDITAAGDDMKGWFKFVSGLPGHEIQYEYDEDNVSDGVHRATFLEALVQHIDSARAHFNKRCVSISSGERGNVIHFQDGTTADADVVLGADGIKSTVRRYVTGTQDVAVDPHLKSGKTICYRNLIPATKALEAGMQIDIRERPYCFTGKDKHLICFTVRARTLINVVAFSSDPDSSPDHYPGPETTTVEDVTTEEVMSTYENYGPEVKTLLSCMVKPTKWKINVVYPHIPPENWTKGSVAVLGDAAHGMLPHLGAGAGQGLEDAYLLGKLLGHPQTSRDNLEIVLRTYASIRQPRTQKVWENTWRAGEVYDGRGGYEGIDLEEMRSLLAYVWDHELDADFDKALEELERVGTFKQA